MTRPATELVHLKNLNNNFMKNRKNKAIQILVDTLAKSCLIFVLIGSTAHARQTEQVQNAQNNAQRCQTVTRTYTDYCASASNSVLNTLSVVCYDMVCSYMIHIRDGSDPRNQDDAACHDTTRGASQTSTCF